MKKKEQVRVCQDSMFVRYLNSTTGITLIALVVTVVVLLILAGITIMYVMGDNSIFKQAKDAEEKTKEATQNEKDDLDKIDYWIEKGGLDGKVELVKSKDGIIVPVPKDFKPSNADGENTVEDGFVIYQGIEEVNNENVEEARKTRNQFVWVPVDDPDSMFGELYRGGTYEGTMGKLYDFNILEDGTLERTPVNWEEKNGSFFLQTLNGCTEPACYSTNAYGNVVDYDKLASYVQYQAGVDIGFGGGSLGDISIWRRHLRAEFKKMADSVKKYNGFYIGRYETGNLTKNKFVVCKENDDISNINWFWMYRISKEITDDQYSSTTMIWGCMWDATIWWMACQGEEKVEYLKNCTKYGNIPEKSYQINQNYERIPTGSNELYKMNNIYDMVGNVGDATMEVSGNSYFGQLVRRR